MKLFIPKQSLSGIKSCTITIRASLSGQYEFPDDTELVSPVFWLSCEPQCSFGNPLGLEIEHCALPENTTLLSMARAHCTQKDLPYTFKMLHGGSFSEASSYGVIKLKSFSGLGVIQKQSKQRRYWSDVFYKSISPSVWDAYFAVTWHQKGYKKVQYVI